MDATYPTLAPPHVRIHGPVLRKCSMMGIVSFTYLQHIGTHKQL